MEYIAAGNLTLDTVRFPNRPGIGRETIGGPATFAYTGIRLWTDDVVQCSNVGEDYLRFLGPWIERNQIDTRGFHIKCERSIHIQLLYREDGTYGPDPETDTYGYLCSMNLGHLRFEPEQVGALTQQGGVKGVYVAQDADRVFWRRLDAIKRRDGFKLMWELDPDAAYPRHLEGVMSALETADIFSLNIQEAERLFGLEGEEACIRRLQQLPVELTLFRVGAKGLYVITADQAIYLPPAPGPVVDPTGCGNCSTGAALYAWCQGYDPRMVGIMANVAAAQNIRQYGVIPDFAAVREEAYAQAKELYQHYKK